MDNYANLDSATNELARAIRHMEGLVHQMRRLQEHLDSMSVEICTIRKNTEAKIATHKESLVELDDRYSHPKK